MKSGLRKKHMKKNTGSKALYVILGTLALVGLAVLLYKLLSQKPGVVQQPPAPLPEVASGHGLPGHETSEVILERGKWWPSIVLS